MKRYLTKPYGILYNKNIKYGRTANFIVNGLKFVRTKKRGKYENSYSEGLGGVGKTKA